jgi:hypothetical protein
VAITFIVALAAVLGKAWSRTRHARIWLSAAAVAFLLGVFAYASHQRTLKVCTARYAGNAVLIGRRFTPLGEGYARSNPTATPQDMLFDAAGRADLVWTADSIASCRSQLLSAGASWLPLLAASLAALLQAGLCWKPGLAAPRSAGVPKSEPAAPVVRYDAFVSYRHGGADEEFARDLVRALEEQGYRIAIDARDFRAEQSFLEEMERCIRQSRFTLALISSRYVGSGNCEEEAVICKVLSMADRRRRLVPLMLEKVDVPVWLYDIVGVDFAAPDPMIEPVEKLRALLGAPLQPGPPGAPAAADQSRT